MIILNTPNNLSGTNATNLKAPATVFEKIKLLFYHMRSIHLRFRNIQINSSNNTKHKKLKLIKAKLVNTS